MAMGRRAVVPALGQISAGYGGRSSCGTESPSAEALRRRGGGQLRRKLSSVPAVSQRRDRTGSSGEASGRGICGRAARVVFAGTTTGRRNALRTATGRRHEGRWRTVHPRGCGGSRMGGGGSGAEAPSARATLPARNLGTKTGRQVDRSEWLLA